MIHIFNKPLGLGNMYENRKMYYETSPCFGKNPTEHANKCLVLTNSFGNDCLEPMDLGDEGLPNVIYCEDINTVYYQLPKLKQNELSDLSEPLAS